MKRLFSAFINPFTVILLVLAVISAFTDIVLADPGEQNYVTVIIIAPWSSSPAPSALYRRPAAGMWRRS